MRDRDLAEKFERYRRDGDVAALGDVFDALAPELARTASHLARAAADVDDLVQATFLTAIEKAEAFDAERRLAPWLMGILVRHAHSRRHEHSRTPDPRRLASREAGEDDPADVAARAEASAALAHAVRALPSRYREVLEPFVLEGTPAAELAARLGRSAGTVRMQQSRGFDLLRRALPAGFAGALAVELGGRGLAAVRQQVLSRAGALAGAAPSASATLLATMTLAQKLSLGAAAALALVGLLVWRSAARAATTGAPEAPLAPPTGPAPAEVAAATASAATAVAPNASAAAAARAEASAAPGAKGFEADATAALASATGRVVEADGGPVAGVVVELYAVGLDTLERALAAPLEPVAPPAAFVARSVTDGDGRFSLTGVRAHAHAVLGVDLGGARPFARLVDEGLARGASRDLGDVVLPPAAPLSGRVVDEAGASVAGARVRVARTTGRDSWAPFLGLDVDTPVHVGEGLLALVVEPPPWFREAHRLLPIALTTTDAEGRFRFAAAPATGASWFVDAPSFRATFGAAPDAEPEASPEAQPRGTARGALGADAATPPGADRATAAAEATPRALSVTLTRGRALRGRVLDADGQPAAGVLVRAGTTGSLGYFGPPLTPFVHRATTDAAGDFELTGLTPGEPALLATRGREGEAWSLTVVKDDGFQTLRLPARLAVVVRVLGPDGAPVEAAELALARAAVLDGLTTGAGLLDPWGAVARAERTSEGLYTFADVAKGAYRLVVRAPGFAVAEARVNARERMKEVVVELGPPRELAVRLVDARTERPIVGARVAVLERVGKERSLGAALTDGDGVARVAVASVALDDAPPGAARPDDGAHVRVDHPAYGSRKLPLPRDAEGGAVAFTAGAGDVPTLTLAPSGSVRIVLQRDGKGRTPRRRAMAELDLPRGPDAYPHYLHRRFGLEGEDGVIEVDGLAPGPWRAAIYTRYLDGDPFDLIDGFWPEHLGRVDVDVRAGETVTVEAPLRTPGAPTFAPGTASLVVRVTRDGAPVVDRHVELTGMDGLQGDASAPVDERGEARFEGLPGGVFAVSVTTQQQLDALTYRVSEHFERLELAAGEARVHTIDVRTGVLTVRVRDERGAPAAGVEVAAWSRVSSVTTTALSGDDGVARFPAAVAGELRVGADDATFGVGGLDVDVPAGGERDVELRLVLGVPCAGTVTTPLGAAGTGVWLQLAFTPLEGGGPTRKVEVELSEGAAPFRVVGVRPGRHKVTILSGSPAGTFVPLEVVVPERGSTELALSLRVE